MYLYIKYRVFKNSLLTDCARIGVRDYYLVKPISTLNYDESSYTFRNLEFGVGHNFSERSHLELSFWDRRAGGNYPANELKGSQMFAKGYYHLSKTLRLDVWAANNSFEADESFGYSNSSECLSIFRSMARFTA